MPTYAEDNPFPYITLVETADPATPAANVQLVWLDTDGTIKRIDETGTVTELGGTDASLTAIVTGYSAHGNTGTTETFDAGTGWHSATLDNNCTFTFTGASASVLAAMVLELAQDGTGSRLVTWPGSVVWVSGSAPTLKTAASGVDILSFFSRDGGTTWYGVHNTAAAPTGAAFSGCRAYETGSQTISTATFTAITLSAEDYDTDGYHTTGGSNSRITIPTGKGGKFQISAGVNLDSNATGQRVALIKLNGTTYLTPSAYAPGTAATGFQGNLSFPYALADGDYIELFVYQDSGGNRITGTSGNQLSFLAVTRLG